MSSVLRIIVLAGMMLASLGGSAFAQPEDYDGPQGFEWVTPPPVGCRPLEDWPKALVLGQEPFQVLDTHGLFMMLEIPISDPEWTVLEWDEELEEEIEVAVTRLIILFRPETGQWVSHIRSDAYLWYFSEECTQPWQVFGDFLNASYPSAVVGDLLH